MAGYIKSHSNYRLQSRHQIVNDGVILERDISTVGGINSFSNGQPSVYQSGNFILVINSDSNIARHVKRNGWLPSGSGDDMWDESVLTEHASDVNGSVEKSIMLKNDFMDLRSFAYYGSLSDLIENTVSKIITTYPYEIYFGNDKCEEDSCVTSNPGNIDIHTKDGNGKDVNGILGHFYGGGIDNYELLIDGIENPPGGFEFTWESTLGAKDWCDAQEKTGLAKLAAVVTIEIKSSGTTLTTLSIGAEFKQDNTVSYRHIFENGWEHGIHIRPKESKGFYTDFIDNLDLFGKCLMGVYTNVKNTARFEILSEGETTTERSVETFVFPTTYGGYNIASDGISMMDYVQRLGGIGLRYDDMYTDNMYRMMTHDSLKNLDWTKNFNGSDGEYDNEYTKSGEKFTSMIRVIGYVFDNEKAYIDSIGNVNTVSYSNRSNLSDYFLTDSLETDGWDITAVYPYRLREYSGTTDVTDENIWSQAEQETNSYKRKFSEITDELIYPYKTKDNVYYMQCSVYGGMNKIYIGRNYEGQYYIDNITGDVCNVFRNYHNDNEVTIPDINNEFMKRLRINSRNILNKKGTIEGIESMLSLFGMRSKNWYDSHKLSEAGFNSYDYYIEEFTTFAPYINDEWDVVHSNYRTDWYNSCKTIPYNTQSYVNGEYISYQGLPVAYRDIESGTQSPNERRLYPYFSSNGVYDGNMYYQMKGGWLDYIDYRFDIDDNMLVNNNSSVPTNVETIRNVMLTNNISTLISQPAGELSSGITFYVTDITEKLALINGDAYPINEEAVGDETKYYFDVFVYGGAVSLGGDLYTGTLTVSDTDGNERDYSIESYDDGYRIKVYYTGDRTNAFHIHSLDMSSGEETMPESSLFFFNGSYDGNHNNTHYFTLTDVDGYGKIGPRYWRQIKSNEEIYQVINTVVDDYEGNNPHLGNFSYDNGREYIDRYRKLFKYASENREFNESCFPNVSEAYDEIDGIGFDIVDNFISDSKVHSFLNTYDRNNNRTDYDKDEHYSLWSSNEYSKLSYEDSVHIYPSNIMSISGVTYAFNDYDVNKGKTVHVESPDTYIAVSGGTIQPTWELSGTTYTSDIDDTVRVCTVSGDTPALTDIDLAVWYGNYGYGDGVTSQIINTKKLRITFRLKSIGDGSNKSLYTKSSQEEIKYIQEKVMPYVSQMLPSSAIVEVSYELS